MKTGEVNLLGTEITALLSSTFAHCVALHCIWLPPRLTRIGKKAFLNCVILQEVVIPTELSDTGNRAFCGCEQLQRFTPWIGEILNSGCRQSTMLSSCVTNLKNPGGWSSSPLMGPIRTPLMKSYPKSTPTIKSVHERLKVGALASVFRKHPWPQEQSMSKSQKLLAQTVKANRRPFMELDDSSKLSTLPEMEPVMDCSLVLTTLSGVTIKVSLSVAKFDRFEDLEDQVMLSGLSHSPQSVWVLHRLFANCHIQTYLEDPIWDRLQQGMAHTVVFKDSSVTLSSQEQLDGCPIHQVPLAVQVPMNPEESVPEGAFAGVPRLRHVSVESDIRLIGAEAWQNCQQLRIVKLPATVVGISDNAFRDCKQLNSVSAPGCRDFGYKAFRGMLFLTMGVCI